MTRIILAGDIGGTNTRLAFFEKGVKVVEKKFSSSNYPGLEQIAKEFIETEKIKAMSACFGIAGAIRNGKCKATNLPWIVEETVLSKTLSIPFVRLLNDLEANAYSLKMLKREDLCLLQSGTPKARGNQALIAAGTGLGEAGLFWDGKCHHPFACEGGHADFAPRNEEEIALFHYLRKKFEHVSCERVVSGPGLRAIFDFLIDTGRGKFLSETKAEMERRNPSMVVSDWGAKGKDATCAHALDIFVSALGAESGNAALKFMSLGGLYLGGGIVPHIIEKLKKGLFLESFQAKGRFRPLLESVPIWAVLNDDTTLLGTASYAEAL